MGSRYGGLKQMDPMGPSGETVLDYSIYDAIKAGFSKVVFIIRDDFADEFKEQVGGRFSQRIETDYAYQRLENLPNGYQLPAGREKPWGTTHAILAAESIINEPFAVINADDFYGADAFQKMANQLTNLAPSSNKLQTSMVGYLLQKTLSDHGDVNRGICRVADGLLEYVEEHEKIIRDDDGVVRGFNQQGEKVELDENSIASMNFWGFEPDIFDHLNEHFTNFLEARGSEMKSESYIPTAMDELIRNGKADCQVLETTAEWFGVTYQQDKPKAVASINQYIKQGIYPSKLS